MPNRNVKSALDIFIEINILLTLFCLPFSKSIVEVCVTLAIIAFFVKKAFIERTFSVGVERRILASLLLFVFFNLLSIVNSQYMALSVQAIFSKVLKWALFFILIADTIKTPRQLKRVFITMLASAALILVDAVYQQYVTGMDFLHYPNRYPVFKFHSRQFGKTTFPTASFPYPNDFAAWINVFLFSFLALCAFDLKKERKYRILTVLLCIFLGFFLFRTASRGAISGAFPALVLFLIIRIKKIMLPLAAVFIVIVLAISFIPYVRNEIVNISQSFDDRVGMWKTGWRIFKEHPIIGNGVNTFFENFRNFRADDHRYKSGSYAHNCFLQMAADIGLLGLVAFLYFAGVVLYSNIKRALKNRFRFQNSFVFGLSLGVIAFLIHSFSDTNLYSLNLAALFWLSLGLIEGVGSHTDAHG